MGSFLPNLLGIKSVPFQPGTRGWAQDAATAVAEAARANAPVRTGHYRRSIKATVVLTGDGWIGRVNAFDFKALWVEYGTNGIAKSRVLGSSLDVVGSTAKIKPGR